MTTSGSPAKNSAAFQLVMPIALVGILLILLFPLPTPVLDVAIALNITISLVVLFVTLYIDKPLRFSAFPAILLITTLFRLSMNVASTRLILLNGDQGLSAAGEVIQAFGSFVVGGNYVVGIVVFIVISIVNLKVITKGSGRIAEVAARFTLDAMPGKQMAIDSDLNTGIIGEDEAKKRRKELAQEAEFYGAMDGAAKFVAGDAMAGILITAINIGGGFFIGIIQEGMSWQDSAQIYTILTIGDGLIAQIPSIIISTGAGIIVARAGSGDDLGNEVLGQLSQSTKPLFLTAGVCSLLAILPGLPFVPFAALAGFAGVLGVLRTRAVESSKVIEEKESKEKTKEKKPPPGSTEEVMGLLSLDTLELELGYELVSLVESGDLVERIRSIRRQFALDYGFVVPPIHIRDNVRIGSTQYRFMLRGSAIGLGELKPHHMLAMDPGNASVKIQGTPTKEPAFGLDAIWIPDTEKERAQFGGYTVVDLSTVITTHIGELVRSHMYELLGRQEAQQLIEKVQKEHPKVVEELIPGLLNLGQVQQVLKNLLREQVSIRDLKTILETLADWAPHIKHPEKLAECCRKKLSRTITGKYANGENVLVLTNFTPNVERALTESMQQTDEGSFLALEPGFAQQIINRLNRAAEKFAESGASPLLLAPSHLRAAVAHFVERFAPGYAVISHQEIAPSTKVQSVGVISVDGAKEVTQ